MRRNQHAAFLTSVAGDVVGRLLVGELPVFHLGGIAAPGVVSLPWAVLLGAAMGLFGVLFNRILLASMNLQERLHHWSAWPLGGLVGAVIAAAGWMLPGLAGPGGELVQSA